MVQSNKKLKQKLREAKSELLLAASEVKLNSKSQESLKSLLTSVTQKPRLSKRDKRREKALTLQDGQKDKEEVVAMSEQIKGKDKKRKRDETEGLEKKKDTGELKQEKKPIKKKKKNKKKGKKQKVEDGEVTNSVNVGDAGNGQEEEAQEPSKTEERNMPVCSREESGDMSKKVYVGGIPYYSTEDDIRSYFEGCGTITEVDCMNFADSGKFRGIAIITLKTEAAAQRAMALDGSDMGGLFLKIQSYKSDRANKVSNFSPNMVAGYNRIYVGNLSWNVTEDDLKKLFSDCSISSIRFGEDKETGEFRGYAHVDFADSLSVNMALKLDQKIVCGRPVRISCAVAKEGAVKKGGATNSRPTPEDQNVDSVATSTVSAKIRRRTCYECGERGHLSSSCPKKQETDQTEQVAT
ncbi:phragmoplastin interacting protein 1 isoform X1 [Lycium ferocissimum]|uniref:phragmoplastin interacting protein 1 isoform X1 n=1 Tax=Lycium ferocissimum TaxID=112874 RepID=UPI0028165896|nr:phragmoplastin interacting protein 1 isoform X1 [Lycium ferocissimum]